MEPSSALFGRYQQFQQGRKRPEDYVKQYSTELGVDQLRTRVGDARGAIRATEDTIKATPGSVAGRTSGSLVSDAARTRLVSNELQPLQEMYRTQSNTFGDVRGELDDALGQVNSKSSLAYNADESQANSLMTLFNAASQREQWEAQMAENRRQFDAQQRASAGGGASPTFGGGGGGGSTDPVQQAAFNEVMDRFNGQNDQALLSDFRATKSSADKGNARDKAKIAVYMQYRPDLFTPQNIASGGGLKVVSGGSKTKVVVKR